ncbi:yqey-like family protein [Clostridium argentinense CDC 2741]|uniref:Yqey-like family protein n=1 Tax=Clostridium argentinense CDC 2741 TaxID=1418104 RepID=A0A0C1U269_9CLOT|nr:GatB/YqeY domain-containing protein [Clostridium argentinense]HAG44129.1 GatB/YqeY domain-containing protein [Clostridium sp.]ARC85528.1 aspartyl-tRNA amidotransferase [Clostridium argentinense]KIE46964.1 yqey-like family protein [Clostridium argentinense CDC 2741]NFF40042.1 GatB/YqeY domain-containing protein [Clostridium argentinense]NFP50258.1 GatB/YqeY domain-containing protein [Clostridium argentinense]
MSLKDRLQEDWKNALKGKEKFKASVISMAKAAILQVEKDNKSSLNDDQVIEVLAKEVKQRRDALQEFEKGNRQDLVDSTNAEIDILLQYLPQQLTEDKIREIVRESAEKLGANSIKDMGKVMAAVRPSTNGRADGKIVSQIVKEYLNK